jgi:GT2 family glycosyltransferase
VTEQSTPVTYIVITHKRPDYLPGCLQSIRMQNHRPLEVILVDNGDDLSEDILRHVQDEQIAAALVSPGRNLGAMEGRNHGVRYATGEILIFLDDDQPLNEEDATSRILATFERFPACGAVTFRCVYPDGEQTILHQLPYPARRNPLSTELMEVPAFWEGQVAIPKAIYDQVGGYPSDFLYCMGAYELALRIIDGGHTILYDSGITATHFRATQGRVVGARNTMPYHCNLNRVRAALRLIPFPFLLTILTFRIGRMLWSLCFHRAMIGDFFRTLRREWGDLLAARRPISWRTVRYIFSIGGWSTFV